MLGLKYCAPQYWAQPALALATLRRFVCDSDSEDDEDSEDREYRTRATDCGTDEPQQRGQRRGVLRRAC
jgi:hypothetical protein